MTTDTVPTAQERFEAEKTAVAAIADPVEQTLAFAEFKARVKVHGAGGAQAIRDWKAAERALMEYRDGAAGGKKFKNVAEVHRHLLREGYDVTDRTVRNHVKQRLLLESKSGGFLLDDVDRYAQTYLHRPGVSADNLPQTSGKEDLVSEQVRKLRLANDENEGRLVPRAEVEQRSASAAAYLKNDLDNFGPRIVQKLIEHTGDLLKSLGVEVEVNLAAITPDLELLYEKELGRYLNRYAEKASFPAGAD